ncbi:MAG: helix-turn-helix transcriptional regulator [Chloroflexota bacterium]
MHRKFEPDVQQQIDSIYTRFAHSVRTIRRAKDWTQHELAQRAGMNKTYLVRIEAGDNNVTLKTAQRLACALEVDLLILIQGVHITIQQGEPDKHVVYV